MQQIPVIFKKLILIFLENNLVDKTGSNCNSCFTVYRFNLFHR